MSYLVCDIGGTKTRVGLSHDLKTFAEVGSFHTPPTFKAGLKTLLETADKFTAKGKIKGIALGIRGVLNEERTGLANDSVLLKWAGLSIVAELKKHYGQIPIFLENDTALAGLGEAVFGAGKGIDIVVYHTISTGVGGVKVEFGELDIASVGFEPGHQVLDIDRTILGADITPTLENLVSGTALENRMGVKPYEIPQTDLIWEELAEYLAQGLRNSILFWSPDAIVLGGSMILGDPKIPLEAIRRYTVEILGGFVPCPFITTAALGDQAGLYGGLVILQKNTKK